MNVVRIISDVLIWCAFGASVFTMVAYHLFAGWRQTKTGKRFMSMLAMKAALLFVVLLHRLYGDFPGYECLLLVVFGFWAISIAGMGFNIVSSQVHGRKQ